MKLLNILGWISLIFLWWFIAEFDIINNRVLPTPQRTLHAYSTLYENYHLVDNMLFSLKINFIGYLESIGLALPVGFLLGSFRVTREMFDKPINALRFIPITALGGIFIALTGLTIWTKIHFLAFGIWVYLVPVVVQRLSEVNTVHLQMMQTLGATGWQKFRYVSWKYTISRLSDDIRILVGISWTYIIVAELKNVQGGLGSMIWLGERQAKVEYVYAVIILIVVIGVLQDFLFKQLDKVLFKFKYC